jgi:hypothetical protein
MTSKNNSSIRFFILCFIIAIFNAKAQTIVIKNPQYDRLSTNVKLTKIEHSAKYTLLNIVFIKKNGYGSVYVSLKKDIEVILKDYDTGKEYPLIEAENISTNDVLISAGDSLHFSLLFNRVPDNIEKVRLIGNCNANFCLRISNILVHPANQTPSVKLLTPVVAVKAAEVVEPSPIYNFTLKTDTFNWRSEENKKWAEPQSKNYTFKFTDDGTLTATATDNNFTLNLVDKSIKFKNPQNVKALIQQYLCSDGQNQLLVIIFKESGELRILNLDNGVQNTFSVR